MLIRLSDLCTTFKAFLFNDPAMVHAFLFDAVANKVFGGTSKQNLRRIHHTSIYSSVPNELCY